ARRRPGARGQRRPRAAAPGADRAGPALAPHSVRNRATRAAHRTPVVPPGALRNRVRRRHGAKPTVRADVSRTEGLRGGGRTAPARARRAGASGAVRAAAAARWERSEEHTSEL